MLCRNAWKNKDCAPIHIWQDRAATVLNKGSSAALTRVIHFVYDKDPRHFWPCLLIGSLCTTAETRMPQQSHSKQTRSRKM